MSKKSKNCKLKDDFKVKAQDACPVTCGECVVPTLAPTPRPSSAEPTPECHDSVSWWSKKSKNDCDYVAKDADGRCGDVDESDVAAEVACPEACGYCGTFSICADSTSWYYKKSKNSCEDYVSKKSKNCKLKDDYKIKAEDACPVTCDTCDGGCADSTSWYYKKSKNTCEDYVTKKSKNCKLEDDSKVKAEDACPVTCGTC